MRCAMARYLRGISVACRADRDSDHERDSDDRGESEPSTDAVRALLLLGLIGVSTCAE
jgi:hypothetical protein